MIPPQRNLGQTSTFWVDEQMEFSTPQGQQGYSITLTLGTSVTVIGYINRAWSYSVVTCAAGLAALEVTLASESHLSERVELSIPCPVPKHLAQHYFHIFLRVSFLAGTAGSN